MHPVFARFLSLERALDTLDRSCEDGLALDGAQAAFVDAAGASPELVSALESGRGQARLSEEAQHALLSLAAQAALRALSRVPEVFPKLAAAEAALGAAGATPEQAEAYLCALVLEEAFDGDEDLEHFDQPFFEETLGSLPAVVGLTNERVAKLRSDWVNHALREKLIRPEKSADALFEAAWAEGPEPITAEHLLTALDALEPAAPRGTLAALLHFLNTQHLLGEVRLQRLLDLLSVGRAV